MKRIKFLSTMFGLSALMFLGACSKTNEPEPNQPDTDIPANETWIIYNANANWSGGIYALKNNKSREINLSGLPFFQVSSSLGGRVLGKTLYKVNSASNAQGILKLNLNTAGQVVQDKFLASLSNAYISNYLVVSATEGYYWDDVRGGLKVQKFNPTTMERTGEIDFSSLSEGLPNESAGQLILAKRDDKLYVDLLLGTKLTGNWQVSPPKQEVAIAVYDLTNNKILNVTKFAGTTNLGVFIDHVLYSYDEVTKDLYFVAVADMKTQPTAASSKILRIKNGETQFDQNFSIDIKNYQFPAEFNRLFVHNSKIYTTIPSRPTSYYGGGQHGVTYRSDVWYWNEIDATTKKATRLNIPADSFYGTSNPFMHNGEIYFLSNNTTEGFSGVNQYNPTTGKIKETFRLKESGRLNGFNIIVD
ncbi:MULTISPECIES: hypothetical protein [Pedobacter]|uniref:DUF5074 domain-containing protein n=1 Tax=Pedobacter agri TaxID=454586 RepID=A0A9X3DFJ6_9SPHI|nr:MULTISPECIES: hypothetical protein [Pedobacter]AZI27427.1 hypothetical protein EA772_19550 [Pedobacter sp. G11]MCX3266317.1 hypothetical protein [Pedobacter agri]MDQ1139158.1 hypothetical protein [Pedobacter agri]